MPQPIAMPQMGVTMEAGTILKWLKQPGDAVRKDEPIMEIQTDKVSLEVTSDVEGTLLAILVGEGKEVPVGEVLAWVGQPGEAVPGAPAEGAVEAAVPAAVAAVPAPGAAEPSPGAAEPRKLRATPAARSRARALGLDLSRIAGTGPAGRIQVRDVVARQSHDPAPAPVSAAPVSQASVRPTAPAAYQDLPVAGLRKVIAERMAQSFHSSVPVLLTAEVEMDRAAELLERLTPELTARAGGKPGYLPLIIRAAAAALKQHPRLNAHWLGSAIRLFQEVNIGVAVAHAEGLTVPVLRSADRMGLAEIQAGVAALAARVRESTLSLADLEGGTFTISNLGGYRIGAFMPVINPPQVAILGAGRAVVRPVVRAGQVITVPVLPLSLVFDHRAVDGAPAAAFLDDLKGILEEPYRLLI